MSDCLFCKVVSGELNADIIFEDDDIVAFHDIHPQAPVHVLVIPRKHIATINDIEPDDAELIGKVMLGAKKVASILGINESGYRTVMNCNNDAGQTVFHLHMHVLGGRRMHWPPG